MIGMIRQLKIQYLYRDRKISDRHKKGYACASLMGEKIYLSNSKHDVTTLKMVFCHIWSGSIGLLEFLKKKNNNNNNNKNVLMSIIKILQLHTVTLDIGC